VARLQGWAGRAGGDELAERCTKEGVSKWLLWIVLSSVTGSPIGALIFLLVVWWTIDRFTTRVLPDPVRGFLRWQRVHKLERTIAHNPSDRRARAELGDIFLQQRRYSKSAELLRPLVELGDEPVGTLYLFALASAGMKQYDQAERVLLAAKKEEPDFRGGDLDLALGRVRFAKGDLKGADEALVAFLEKRRFSIEGRVLLAKVREKAGDVAAAQKLRAEAWAEYRSSPPAHRRRDRWFAWQAKPVRPIAYGAVAVFVIVGFALFGAPRVREVVSSYVPAADSAQHEDEP
jgi:tetratricopeptide (TPR) repeat protein